MSGARDWIRWGGIAVVPVAALLLLVGGYVSDPAWTGPIAHFYIVSTASLIAALLATLMAVAANQVKDARVFFLSLGFVGLASIFLVHALTTPGALVPSPNPWVGFSARLSLLVGAACLALSTVNWSPALQRAIATRQWWLGGGFVAAILAYGALALTQALRAAPTSQALASGSHGHDYGLGDVAGYESPPRADMFELLASPTVSWGITAATLGLLGLVILRYSLLYRLSRTPLLAGFLASAIFLAQAQLAMTIAPTWHLSWWEYHALLLLAFGAAVVGLLREYSQSGDLRGVIEGLLLRDTIVQLQRGYTDVIVALVEAVEAKDPYTRGHTQRVTELAVLIGTDLKLPPERLRILSQSAMLHDIGKIGIPDAILNKPGPLTPEEFAIIKQHPVRGHRIIQNVRSLQQEIRGVRHHHERLDGSGYPDGLKGEAIPLEARIIAVADVFDALTSARPYRPAWTVEEALAEIDRQSGTKLDPQCVAALHRILPDWLSARTEPPRPAARAPELTVA